LPELWVMTLLAAVHSLAGTFQSAAAAAISISRAHGAALADILVASRMPRLRRSRNSSRCGALQFSRASDIPSDLVPIAIPALRRRAGEAGQRALPHLRTGDPDHHLVVGWITTQALISFTSAAWAASKGTEKPA